MQVLLLVDSTIFPVDLKFVILWQVAKDKPRNMAFLLMWHGRGLEDRDADSAQGFGFEAGLSTLFLFLMLNIIMQLERFFPELSECSGRLPVVQLVEQMSINCWISGSFYPHVEVFLDTTRHDMKPP